jgi:hypothetical protein
MIDRLLIFAHENTLGILLALFAVALVWIFLLRRAELREPQRNFGFPKLERVSTLHAEEPGLDPDHPQRRERRQPRPRPGPPAA